MIVRLKHVVLWQYDPATPEAVLRRHHRTAKRIIWAMCATGVLLVSSMAESVFSDAPSLFLLVVISVSAVLGILLLVPGTLSVFWIREIERTLAQRGTRPDPARTVERRIAVTAMKMVFWFVLMLLAVHYLPPRVPSPYAPP